MRNLLTALIIVAGLPCPADPPRLDSAALPPGERYQPPATVQIIWKATNDLPKALWVYKVVPQEFPAAVVTNLLAIGHLQAKDTAKQPANLPLDRNLMYFRDKTTKWNHSLLIAPTLGWIQYTDQSGSSRELVEGVPGDAEVETLALDCLFRLGIDRSLLADKPRSRYPAVQGKLDSHGQKLTEEVFQRGISFVRRIDGVMDAGKSFWIEFGNRGKIKRFDLVWRSLSPHEIRPLALPNEVIAVIREGRAVAPMQDFDWTASLHATQLIITDVRLYYFDRPGIEPLDFMYPYAELELAAHFGTNMSNFYLSCPILSTNTASTAQ
jgi:hypothetical protein